MAEERFETDSRRRNPPANPPVQTVLDITPAASEGDSAPPTGVGILNSLASFPFGAIV